MAKQSARADRREMLTLVHDGDFVLFDGCPDNCWARGRNGWIENHGIVVSPRVDADIVLLESINVNLEFGSAALSIPVTHLPELIRILGKFVAGPLSRLALAAEEVSRPSLIGDTDAA